MATMSPEEVLLTTMQPTLRALDNRAQGGADFAKAQYLNAVQQANSATDFARRAQEAQRMFALNAGLTRETQKNIADREDQRQENYLERDEQRQKNELEKAEKAQAWLFDRMTAQKKQEKIDEIETILGTLAPEVPKTATLEQKLKLYSDKLSEVVERNLTSIDKNIEAFKKSVAKAAKAQITPEALEAQFVREAIAARVGVTMDESGKPTFLDQAKADELQKRYSQALVASQGNRDTAAQQVFGVSALALRDQLKEQLTEQYQEALLRTPAYAKQLEALVTQRTRMESQSPAANFRKLANSIVLPEINNVEAANGGDELLPDPSQFQGGGVINPTAPAWLGEAVLSPELRATPQQAQPTFTPPAITPESIFAPEAINSVAARRALPMGGVVDGGAIIAPQPVPMPFRAKGMGVPGMVNLFNPVSPQNIVNRIYGNAPGGNGLGLGSNIYFGPQPITPDYFTVSQ